MSWTHWKRLVKTGGDECYFKHQNNDAKLHQNMKNHGNMTLPQAYDNFPVTDPSDMEVYSFPNKVFRIAALQKLQQN